MTTPEDKDDAELDSGVGPLGSSTDGRRVDLVHRLGDAHCGPRAGQTKGPFRRKRPQPELLQPGTAPAATTARQKHRFLRGPFQPNEAAEVHAERRRLAAVRQLHPEAPAVRIALSPPPARFVTQQSVDQPSLAIAPSGPHLDREHQPRRIHGRRPDPGGHAGRAHQHGLKHRDARNDAVRWRHPLGRRELLPRRRLGRHGRRIEEAHVDA